jgi:ribosomal protein S27E
MLQFKLPTVNSNNSLVIQPKLKIGKPGDKYEREADAVADRVMRMSESETMQMQPVEEEEEMMQPKLRMQPMEEEEEMVQTKIQKQEEEEEEPIQMKCAQCENEEVIQASARSEVQDVSSKISSQLFSSKGSGSPLPKQTNKHMSNALGTDFSEVKIHTSNNAIQMNKSLNAKAFTHGSDIYFNQGEYNPSGADGKRLLAHELTHVVQQNAVSGHPMINKTPDPPNSVSLPTEEKNELKRLTGNRIDRSASYYNDALLEVKIKVGNMIKEQQAAADAMFELAFGLLMPGVGKLIGRGLAGVAATLPASASTASYRAAIALLDANRTKEIFTKATDIGYKVSKISIKSQLKSITGDAEDELFFTALEKSAAEGFDKIDSELSTKSDKELGILYMSYDPTETTSSDYVRVIEDLFLKYKEQVKPIGKKTDGSYGQMKARWIEGSKWKALALTGEGRYFNVGGGPKFISWISPEMKKPAIEATKAINWGNVDTVHYGTVSGPITTNGFKFMLDSDFPMTGSDVAIEPSSGTTKKPDRQICPSCHGETGPGAYPDFNEPGFELPNWQPLLKPQQQAVPSESELQVIQEWLQSIPKE